MLRLSEVSEHVDSPLGREHERVLGQEKSTDRAKIHAGSPDRFVKRDSAAADCPPMLSVRARPRAASSSIKRRYVGFAALLSVLIAAACGLFVYAAVVGSHTTRSWRLSAQAIAGVDTLNRDLVRISTAVHAAIDVDRPDPIDAVLPQLAGQDGSRVGARRGRHARPAGDRRAAARRGGGDLVTSWITPGVSAWGHTSAAAKRARAALVDRQTAAGQAALLAFATAKEQEAVGHGARRRRRLRTELLAGGAGLVALALGVMLLAAVEVRRLVVRPALALQEAASRVSRRRLRHAGHARRPEGARDGRRRVRPDARDAEAASAAARRSGRRPGSSSPPRSRRRRDSSRSTSSRPASPTSSTTYFQAIIGQAELLRAAVSEVARAASTTSRRPPGRRRGSRATMLVASGPRALRARAGRRRRARRLAAGARGCPGAGLGVRPVRAGATLVGDEPHVRQALGSVVANAWRGVRGAARAARSIVARRVPGPRGRQLSALTHSAATARRVRRLRVSDRGEGMSGETIARACDPFYSTRFAGRGLGLATALGIVRAHRGALDLAEHARHRNDRAALLPGLRRAA